MNLGYFDLQVNGYGGVDFNADDLHAEALHRACQLMQRDGVDQLLATVITDEPGVMERRLRRIAECRAADPLAAAMIAGVHVEGPFISSEPGYVGAHPAPATRPASRELAARLLEAADGLVRLVTLAPERDPGGALTRWLVSQGVRVSAGHCNPSLQQLEGAIDAGLSLFTHLGNGCPLMMHRHENIIQRALNCADRLWVCFIADGVHVPLPALKNYLAVAGRRAIVVSDAIAAAGMGPGTYQLAGQQVTVDDQLATWSADRSHLIGSACTMAQMVTNLRNGAGAAESDISLWTRHNPRAALGCL